MSDEYSMEKGSMPHRAVLPLVVCLGAAALLTAFRDGRVSWTLLAVGCWLWALFWTAARAAHQWDVCPLCDGPPARLRTAAQRARLARRVHGGRVRRFLRRTAVYALAAFFVMPKPYLEHVTGWWRLALAAAYVLVAYVTVVRSMLNANLHRPFVGECHEEWCRAGRDRLRQGGRVRTWTAHHGAVICLALIPPTVTVGVVAVERGMWWQVAYGGGLLVVLYVMACMLALHARNLCPLCASRLPANAEELAERRMPWLRRHHRYRASGPVAVGLLWVASWVAAGTVGGRGLLALAGLVAMCLVVLNRVHGQVQPWCPWCREDGGDEAEADAPDPSTVQPVPA